MIALELPIFTIQQAKAGDEAAFEQLVRRYERQVFGTALRLVNGGREDARDASQQVFMRVHRHFNRFREDQNLSHWLYRLTVNVCHDINRKSKRGQSVTLEETASRELPADEAIAAAQRRSQLSAALRELPEKERAAIVLRDIQGLQTREVARILNSSEATVRSQISAGRRRIKEIIERRTR